MTHEKARWKVLGCGIDDKTFKLFDFAVDAMACELSAEADREEADGCSSVAHYLDEVEIPKVLRWKFYPAQERGEFMRGSMREIRLETYGETERRLMGKSWNEE